MIKLRPDVLLHATDTLIKKLNDEVDSIELEKHEMRLERQQEWDAYRKLPFYRKMFAEHPRDNFDLIAAIRMDDRVKARVKIIDELAPLRKTLRFAVDNGMLGEVELPLKFYRVLDYVKSE